MTLANHDRVLTRGLAIDLTVSMAEFTREDRQEVAAMNVEEQKEAVEGADNAIARRLREMQFRAARPAPVTPAEPQNTPTALAVKACRERDEAVAARDEAARERDRLARELDAVSAERDAAVAGRDAAVAAGSAAVAARDAAIARAAAASPATPQASEDEADAAAENEDALALLPRDPSSPSPRGAVAAPQSSPPSAQRRPRRRGKKSKRDGTPAGALMRSPPRRADDDDGIAKSPARKAPLVEYIDTEDDGDALAQLPRATDPAEEIDAAEMEAESTTTMEPVAGPAPTVTGYTARADQLLAFLASKGLTTDHGLAVAALESSGGDAPGAIAFLQRNSNYLLPASRT